MDRRSFLKSAGTGLAAGATLSACKPKIFSEAFLQQHFKELSDLDLKNVISRLEQEYETKFKTKVNIDSTGPIEGVLFGYGLDLSRCNGNRKCVSACVKENNQSRDPEIQWIKVFQMEREKGIDFDHATPYYGEEQVPEDGKFYFPVACQHCEEPPCTKVCPTGATWKEKDGIVVIDYDWCIGCRYCMAACPYGARRFNWAEPNVPAEELNPQLHYLGNRPRSKGVVEKCTFCIQRTRHGKLPACQEACPTGARIFGNLLDPNSDLRQAMKQGRTFILKEELNTRPKFFYFYGLEDGISEGSSKTAPVAEES